MSVFPQAVRPTGTASQARECLLVFFFDFRLLDNLNTAIETVRRYTMS